VGTAMLQSASQTVGPFFRIGLIYSKAQSNLVNENTSGERITLTGIVFDGDGQPIPDAMIEIWQPDSNGIYNHPLDPLQEQADPHFQGFGRAENRNEGKYEFNASLYQRACFRTRDVDPCHDSHLFLGRSGQCRGRGSEFGGGGEAKHADRYA
jgi:protocatechuate 3,4-dioxygenase beta subunit